MDRADHYIAGVNQAIAAGRDDVAMSLADEYAKLLGIATSAQPRGAARDTLRRLNERTLSRFSRRRPPGEDLAA